MKKVFQSVILALASVALLSSCGGGVKVVDTEPLQKWQQFNEDGTPVVSIFSYNYNMIDGVPTAMQIIYAPNNAPDIIGGNMWGIAFMLVNISKDKDNTETPTFDSTVKSITMANELGGSRGVKVLNGGENVLNVAFSEIKEVPREVEETMRNLCDYKDVAITAKLSNGKQYTWKFHSHLDLPNQ